MARVTVLLNTSAGAARRDPNIAFKIAESFRAASMDADIEFISAAECAARCRSTSERGEHLIVVGGGDGTISAAASMLVGTGTILGILPLGTLNHFARDLGVPDELKQAAELIGRRSERLVDVAQMNDRMFINNSAIGLYPLMVVDRDLQRRTLGRSKRLAMIVASIRTLARFGHQRLMLTVNDEKTRADTPLLFVGNNAYRLDIGAPGQREAIDQGQLNVLVMRKKTRLGFVAASTRALFNRARNNDMVQLEQVERLRVECNRSVLAVSLDGEVVHAKPPLEYKIRKKALRVIAP